MPTVKEIATNTNVKLPIVVLFCAAATVIGGAYQRLSKETDANSLRIEKLLIELKHMRLDFDNHCAEDTIKSAADVHQAMRN